MPDCPWYVSAAAVSKYMEIVGQQDFDDASDELIEMAAETWRRYEADPGREPSVSGTGAYVYRGPGPRRLRFVVVLDERREGSKGQLVDVLPASEHGGGRSESGKDRHRQRQRANIDRLLARELEERTIWERGPRRSPWAIVRTQVFTAEELARIDKALAKAARREEFQRRARKD